MRTRHLNTLLTVASVGILLLAGCGDMGSHSGGSVNSSRHTDHSTGSAKTSKTGFSNSGKKPTNSGSSGTNGSDSGSKGGSNGSSKGGSKGSSKGGSKGSSKGSSKGGSKGSSKGGSKGSSKGGSKGSSKGGSKGSSKGGSTGNTTSSKTSTTKAGADYSAMKPMTLTTLPEYNALKPFNPALKDYHEISNFIPDMGYHWAAPTPGLVLMTNNFGQTTAIETSYPEKLGSFPWNDPPTTEPNGGVAWNSEHLYFVPPSSITTRMASTMPSDLTSWTKFLTANPRLSTYTKEPTTYKGYSIYAPTTTGPAIKVLVSSTGTISGFMTSEPESWGWFKEYTDPKGHPVPSKLFGKAYLSVIWLTPPGAK